MSVPSGWRILADESHRLYSPAGFRLVDDFTGKAPLGDTSSALDLETAPGVWEATDVAGLMTSSQVLIYPGLGRRLHPAGIPSRHYRMRLYATLYRPEYLKTQDGVAFFAPPYDDENEPVPLTSGPADVYLYPACNYPFPTWVRVLHGTVVDGAGAPVPNVLVHQAAVERALTDERGAFALPLRWATSGLVVDADDQRNVRHGSHVLNLPNDLKANLTITVV